MCKPLWNTATLKDFSPNFFRSFYQIIFVICIQNFDIILYTTLSLIIQGILLQLSESLIDVSNLCAESMIDFKTRSSSFVVFYGQISKTSQYSGHIYLCIITGKKQQQIRSGRWSCILTYWCRHCKFKRTNCTSCKSSQSLGKYGMDRTLVR
jgi:hypothetical protein